MARRTEQYLISLVHELIKFDTETEWVEFKTNNCEPQLIGEYISALTLESDNSSESDTDAESSISIAETDEIKQNPIIKTAKSNVRFLTEIISPHILEQS